VEGWIKLKLYDRDDYGQNVGDALMSEGREGYIGMYLLLTYQDEDESRDRGWPTQRSPTTSNRYH
jgi:hypothetical protein